MIGIDDLNQWLGAFKGAIDAIKSARDLLPTSTNKLSIDDQIRRAEETLRVSNSKLAESFGYPLCQCTFSPQIMLWQEAKKAHVCSNLACGRMLAQPDDAGDYESDWLAARR